LRRHRHRARSWWQRVGFQPFDDDDPAEMDRYLLRSAIEGALAGARSDGSGRFTSRVAQRDAVVLLPREEGVDV